MTKTDEDLLSSGDTTLRRGLMGNTVVLVLTVSGIIGALLLVSSYRAIDAVSDTAINQAVERTESDIRGFMNRVDSKTRLLQDWGEAGELTFGPGEFEQFNARMRPLLDRNQQLTVVAVGDSDGRQYVLWRDYDSWLGRYLEGAEVDEAQWFRWSEDEELLEEWTEPVEQSDWQRPWYQGAMAVGDGNTYWTEPFVFFTHDEPGMAASRRFEEPDNGVYNVVAIGVSLRDMTDFTRRMRPSENGYNAVLTATGEVVGLPALSRYDDEEVIGRDVLQSWQQLGFDVLGQAFETWQLNGESDTQMSVEYDGQKFWTGFRSIELGDQSLVAATLIPRQDLTGAVDRQRYVVVAVGLLGIGLAVLLSMWISGRYEKRMEEVFDEAQRLGEYRLKEKFAVGGMGEIYRAEHAMLERPTAVKLLKSDLHDEQSIQRFKREVKMTCRLTHPNTVTIFDYGETESGLFYYAMEFLEGVTLDQFLAYTGALSEGRVVYLMRQVCGALIEAHGIGLIHRDIKPSNIMVGSYGGLGDRVTVLDFGLVKDIETPDNAQLTNQDYLQGSPGFMAPEVIQGEAAESATVDIFAVGAVMYTLLCDQNPFDGETPLEIIMNQVQQNPIPPSEVLERDVDPDLEELIMSCLAKTPEQRPSSMEEIRQVLLELSVRQDWSFQDAQQWWELHGDDAVPETETPGYLQWLSGLWNDDDHGRECRRFHARRRARRITGRRDVGGHPKKRRLCQRR